MKDAVTATQQEVVFLFPGQGSQHYQMARELYEADADFRGLMTALDREHARKEGCSLLEHLYGPRSIREPFDDIRLTHPLIVMVEYCLATTLSKRGVRPALIVASSVGEFAAHAFTGKITIQRALEMVTLQAKSALSSVEEGFMLAVMEPLKFYEMHVDLQKLAYLAGISFPGAIVLSGSRRNLPLLEQMLKQRGASYQTLPVRVPFHSPLVEPMYADWMGQFADDIPEEGDVPVIGQFPIVPGMSYAQSLWAIIRQPFDFQAMLTRLDPERAYLFVDVGPSGTLANWIKYSSPGRSHWQTCGILSPWGGDLRRFQKLLPLEIVDSVVEQLDGGV